jgi:hypothetical protein
MKIAVAGADGSGKTVLATALAERLRLPLLPNSRDSLLADTGHPTLFEWLKAGGDPTAALMDQVQRERETKDGVIDHGALDQLCFLQRWAWNRIAPDRFERLHTMVADTVASYTHVVVTAPHIVAPFAPWRFRSPPGAKQHHRLLLAMLTLRGDSGLARDDLVILLPEGDADTMLDHALARLRA